MEVSRVHFFPRPTRFQPNGLSRVLTRGAGCMTWCNSWDHVLDDLTAVAESRSVIRRRWCGKVSPPIAPRLEEHVAGWSFGESRRDKTGTRALAGKASKSQPVLATKPEEEQVDGTRALVNRRKQLGGLSVGAATACTFICRKKVKYFRQLRSGHAWYFSLVLADNKVFKDHKIWINAFCLKQSFDMFILFCFCVQNWYIPLCHDRVKTRQSLSQTILGPQK